MSTEIAEGDHTPVLGFEGIFATVLALPVKNTASVASEVNLDMSCEVGCDSGCDAGCDSGCDAGCDAGGCYGG